MKDLITTLTHQVIGAKPELDRCALHRILNVLFFLLVLNVAGAQNHAFRLSTSTGLTSQAQFADGYFFAFDIGIPVFKHFEIAPTFLAASMSDNTFASFYYSRNTDGVSFGTPLSGPGQEFVVNDHFTSVGVVVSLRLFSLLDPEKLDKWDLRIGGGLTYDSYSRANAVYDGTGSTANIIAFSQKSVRDLQPIFGKIVLDRYLTDRLMLGVTGSVYDFDGDGALFLGIQLGCNL